MPARTGKQRETILHATKVNERWRVALAGLVAALAIPFLIVDSPAPAGGVETVEKEATVQVAAPAVEPEAEAVEPTPTAVEIVVTTTEVSPDIDRLADQAGTWGLARAQAIEDGRVEATFTAPPSETDYSLLPVVVVAQTEEAAEEPEPEVLVTEEPVETTTTAPAVVESTDPAPTEEGETSEEASTAPGPAAEPSPDSEAEPAPKVEGPVAPAQVDGRVPPPAGGPTAAQWDALRKCESTHNYSAVSPSGLYRGAYQFSQQTWNWVAGIHLPHLVSVDPSEADPAWQDVMAYTLYAMRGWDQWPICGKNLL